MTQLHPGCEVLCQIPLGVGQKLSRVMQCCFILRTCHRKFHASTGADDSKQRSSMKADFIHNYPAFSQMTRCMKQIFSRLLILEGYGTASFRDSNPCSILPAQPDKVIFCLSLKVANMNGVMRKVPC